ncbi:cobalamin biosynthesis protein CobW [Xylanimonas oleitrophica]|uniref:Cobalamin biosynthesis protein CobW n=1 Tax=Xylanimonas oleitrophica TaxID=2607479 RepID=A0A2W5X1N6_9MICO|nr:GTP-binding protein [Xylanimonas oleitrophica]PZR54215.1 cobalamin biosynthesis protein CobW [Xylanimonas oleitrophica]
MRAPLPSSRPSTVPLGLLAAVDPVLRESTLTGLVLDSPGTVAVRHDLLPDQGALRRVVLDSTGVIEDETVPLEHACLSCSVREDAVPTLARLAADGRWTSLVLALPTTAEPLPVARALAAFSEPGGELDLLHLSSTLAAVDLDTLEHDLLGDDLVGDRDLAMTDDDERAVGEALAAQLEQVDLVVTTGADPTGSGLLDGLRARESRRVDGLFELTTAHVMTARHDPAAAERRAHPLGAHGTRAPSSETGREVQDATGDRSWTLVLESPLPFHPERLLANVERLSPERLRSRGVFHVPDRPDSVCLWDGAGGQLCVADLGTWDEAAAGTTPVTRIVVLGAGDPDEARARRQRLVEAFYESLATPEECADGGLRWLGSTDVLAPWLGARAA